MILAGIDIGTNALRLFVAEINGASCRELHSRRISTRLGQDLDRTGSLSADARERTVSALEDFANAIRRYAATQTVVVGTSALRNAANAAEFLHTVRIRTGLDITIIDGASEARLTLMGVQRALRSECTGITVDYLKKALVLDVGGGSTELIITRDSAAPIVASLPLGAVYLTERFLKNNPVHDKDLRGLRQCIDDELGAWERTLHGVSLASLHACAGTAGTVTTLAAMDLQLPEYDPKLINGHMLSPAAVEKLVQALSTRTLQERRNLPGLEQGREDIILAGAVVVLEILKKCGCTGMLVSDWGLREGIVFDLYDRLVRVV